jgi:hypothetical protein
MSDKDAMEEEGEDAEMEASIEKDENISHGTPEQIAEVLARLHYLNHEGGWEVEIRASYARVAASKGWSKEKMEAEAANHFQLLFGLQ